MVVAAGRAPAAARAIKVGRVEASTIPHGQTIALRPLHDMLIYFFLNLGHFMTVHDPNHGQNNTSTYIQHISTLFHHVLCNL